MVLSPMVKASSVSVAGSTAAGMRLSHFAVSSRRSEPKLQFEQSPRGPWRMTRWPTSPVGFKRFSAGQVPASPVQVVKQSFLDEDDNQAEAELSSLTSPGGGTTSSHELSFAGLWKRRIKQPQDDAEPAIEAPATPEKKNNGTIDLVDIRNSLAKIKVHVRPVDCLSPGQTISQAVAEEFGRDISLMRTSIHEELEEFRRNPEEKVKMFPDYFSSKEKEILKQIAESLRLGCQIGETNISVFKTGPYEGHTVHHARLSRHRSASESLLNDEVFVDVPSLAQHGKDGFIARLRLRRLNSGGGIRRNMLWDVAQLTSADGIADPVSGGEGGVYAVQSRSSGEKLAMFKPTEEEKFVREGIFPGEGAVREEAAYVLDSRSNGFSGVPATAVARLHVANIGHTKSGSVQRFMVGSKGSMESYGMPFDLDKAVAFVPIDQVHRIGLLDIRSFNTDRHPGNILLIGERAPYTMVPIDHGCILPSWFHMSEARFDWVEYPQCKVPFSRHALDYIDSLESEADAAVLRKLGIREECVTTMKICTMFMKLAAKAGRNLHWMGSFMQRSGCLENPSQLECAIRSACTATGIPFTFVVNEYNEQKADIPRGILSRRPPSQFFKHMERILKHEIQGDA